MMKSGIRVLAIDDARFGRDDADVLMVGVVSREDIIEGILSFRVAHDGDDSTDRIISSVNSSRFNDQIKLIVMNGTTVAGMNVVDIVRINSLLKVPVIGITRKKPHPGILKRSIIAAGSSGYRKKIAIIDSVSKGSKTAREEGFYVQYVGMEKESMHKYFRNSIKMLRLAHLIASGISSGESRGRV